MYDIKSSTNLEPSRVGVRIYTKGESIIMQTIRKILIVALVLVAAGAALAAAADCEIYERVAARLVADAPDLSIPEAITVVVEVANIDFVKEAVEEHVSVEKRRKAHVFVTIVKALGKAALKGVAIVVRHVF